ncbi:MAG: putative integral membrane protein [Candidatus Accumulibacter appositus]|uniref:Putative integral membrane protein n=1 Tax=Candidatus Accumulibacter appositus TaxID=1454003 RepID=A0A011NIK4_9PROT|nr:DUF2189 domain-containing protein [Accumulibacter sp.]EXI82623.1 MAG: putative integral membrane protein [Candidatus Accumulibacter appositus]HRF05332.1 DUF2189 domain-containing protein [Accumulibacter sp.]
MGLEATSPERRRAPLNVRSVAVGQPLLWLAEAWRDMRANPIASLSYGLLFAIFGDLITIFAWRQGHLFIAATSGFLLIAPLLCGGLYEISRRRQAGQSSTFLVSLAGGRRNARELIKLGVLLALVGLSWERISTLLFLLLAPHIPPDLLSLLAEMPKLPENRDLMIIWLLSGGSLALLVFAITVVSVPLLLDRRVDFIAAMRTSLRAVDANIRLMILWAAMVATLTVLGIGTLFFGLIVLMPLIGHASWHAYRDLVE